MKDENTKAKEADNNNDFYVGAAIGLTVGVALMGLRVLITKALSN